LRSFPPPSPKKLMSGAAGTVLSSEHPTNNMNDEHTTANNAHVFSF